MGSVWAELNVKSVEFVADMEAYLTYTFKPQFKVLGKKVGGKIGAIKNLLAELNGHSAKSELDKTGQLVLELSDGPVTLLPEDIDVTMSQTPGYISQHYGEVTVALATTLTNELIEEGFVREIISKVQTMRKENGYQVTDRIKVALDGSDKLAAVAQRNEAELKKVLLADSITIGAMAESKASKEWNINGENVTIFVL